MTQTGHATNQGPIRFLKGSRHIFNFLHDCITIGTLVLPGAVKLADIMPD